MFVQKFMISAKNIKWHITTIGFFKELNDNKVQF